MRSRDCNSASCMPSIIFSRKRVHSLELSWMPLLTNLFLTILIGIDGPLSLVWKPHHNVLTGNYDVNVLIAALESRSYRVVWHDRRNGASSINLAEETLFGIMLNIPVRKLGGLRRGSHWVTLRRVSGVLYNSDSDLAKPKKFQHKGEVTEFLDCVISQGGELLIVLGSKVLRKYYRT